MRVSNFAIAILILAVSAVGFIGPVEAKSDENMGNAKAMLDETLGAIVKSVASTYVNFINIESKRSKALSVMAKVDAKNFAKYYSQEYHHVANKIPYEILPYCGISSSMSKSAAMGYVSSFSKERVKQIINSIPNSVAGACFRRMVSYKLHGNPTEADVKQAASEFAQETINKLQ